MSCFAESLVPAIWGGTELVYGNNRHKNFPCIKYWGYVFRWTKKHKYQFENWVRENTWERMKTLFETLPSWQLFILLWKVQEALLMQRSGKEAPLSEKTPCVVLRNLEVGSPGAWILGSDLCCCIKISLAVSHTWKGTADRGLFLKSWTKPRLVRMLQNMPRSHRHICCLRQPQRSPPKTRLSLLGIWSLKG